jgi:DNA adenine methylase
MWKSLVGGKKMPLRIEKDFYSDVRDCFNGKNDKYTDDIIGWVGYMGSFNGRFFDGGYSGHNVVGSNGKARDYITENINNTTKQIPFLQDVEWQSGEYYNIDIPQNSLIYCDPPYKGTKEYQFSRGFDYDKFYDWCREMSNIGHTVIISEYNMPEDFKCIWCKELTNAMNPTITKKAVEKLFKLNID